MDKLVKKFEELTDNYKFDPYGILNELPKDCAELTKQIAIEFAKYYLSGTIKKHYAGSIGDENKVEEYRTPEMDLLLGDLINTGENNFNKFLEDYGK